MTASRSAAWRLAGPGVLVFALGSAAVLGFAYRATIGAIEDQFDALLTSEAADLAGEANEVPESELASWVVKERDDFLRYLELRGGGSRASTARMILVVTDGDRPIAWAGTSDPSSLVRQMARRPARTRRPVRLEAGEGGAVLRAARWRETGRSALIALTPPDQATLLRRIAVTLAALWAAVVAIGSGLSLWSVRRVLRRVEGITGAAAAITDPESGRRIPESDRGDEIDRLGATLNRMLDRIAAGAREVRDLSQTVAHDLRSPVTVIRGRLEMGLTAGSEPALEEAAAQAIEGLDRMASILEAQLDVAEAEGGALRPQRERLDLARLCRELAELYEAAAAEHGLALATELDEPTVIAGDPHLLGRALSNLLDNAIHHAQGASRILLTCTREGEGVRLVVEDDGPGFSADLRERAFERWARRPGSPGFGLGLLQVRAAARAHGGEARLASGELGGAAVSIHLPAAPSPESL